VFHFGTQVTDRMESKSEIEAVVARVSEFTKSTEMKEVKVGEIPILLVKTPTEFYAVGSRCTHYGAPLIKGVVQGERVVCPWHGACFNLSNGDIEDAPALDPIEKYSLRISGDEILVRVPAGATGRRQPAFCRADPGNRKTIVVVGAGAAGLVCFP